MTSREAEEAASAHDVETMGAHRFTLGNSDVRGLLLGFAAFDDRQIRIGVERLGAALEQSKRQRHGQMR
jgi:GntR family transcriptional regulator/MocR family aminotransferase